MSNLPFFHGTFTIQRLWGGTASRRQGTELQFSMIEKALQMEGGAP